MEKTEYCINYLKGTCKYGRLCKFAHGESDLRPPVRYFKYKTVYCAQFQELGTCSYGHRCQFIHDETYEQLEAVRAKVILVFNKNILNEAMINFICNI
nr:Zfs1 [Schmidtea mediterranea]